MPLRTESLCAAEIYGRFCSKFFASSFDVMQSLVTETNRGRILSEHHFGSPWTEIKLDAVQYYLEFYTEALKNKNFELWYIDAFAGSGERSIEIETGGLLEGSPAEIELQARAGSVKRALHIDPPFQKFVLIEKSRARANALAALKDAYPERDITIERSDSNEALVRLLSTPPWSSARNYTARGVLFLDPYGMTVPWSTLKLIADTKALDVWYLFPLGGVVRQLANNFEDVDEHKAASLDRVFGTEEWRSDFYVPTDTPDMFSGQIVRVEKKANGQAIEAWFANRLRDHLFPYVSEPIPIGSERTPQKFSLIFAVANPDPRAMNPAKNCMKSLVKKFHSKASRRKSGR
jgi:three-Cys-motif partner protein